MKQRSLKLTSEWFEGLSRLKKFHGRTNQKCFLKDKVICNWNFQNKELAENGEENNLYL